jgi:type IV pilus assembly protein PilQ
MMKHRPFFLFGISLLFSLQLANAAVLEKINFYQKGELSYLEFLLDDNNVAFTKGHLKGERQIILDFADVSAQKKALRAFDTSEFSGGVVYVSAYKKPNSENDLRIAVQLRENVRSVIERRSNKIVMKVENRFAVVENAKTFEEKTKDAQESSDRVHVPKSASIEDILQNLTLSGRKKYIGKKISFNFKDISVEGILKILADVSGFNIILTDEIKQLPPLSLALNDVPWDHALDTILGLNKLVANRSGAILMITTLAKATEAKREQAEAKKLASNQESLVSRIFPISYAKTSEIIPILNEYLTPNRGKIAKDERTNSLIVKDTASVIEKIRKIVVLLDTQTPQVLIESKIVEVFETYSKEIGLQNGFNFGYDPVGSIGTAGASPVGGDIVAGTDGGPGFTFSSAPSTGDNARTLFGLSVARFNRLVNLNFALQILESESKGKIIASPKVITQNKKKATLKTKDVTSFSVVTGSGDSATTSFQESTAELVLEVTPQVTNEGSISLDINLQKEQFGARPSSTAPPNKQSRDLETTVLVDNGSTIVLGGIYSYEKRESHSGIPFLKDIPLIGWLFRTPYNPQSSKNELIIFLTPRIINQEEAGLSEQT